MSRIAVTREEQLVRLAMQLVLCPDRRQCQDRRSGPPRGGRRATDPAPDSMYSAVVRNASCDAPQIDGSARWAAAVKLQSTLN